MTLEIKAGPPSKNLSNQVNGNVVSIEYSFRSCKGSLVEHVCCKASAATGNIRRASERHFNRPVRFTAVHLVE